MRVRVRVRVRGRGSSKRRYPQSMAKRHTPRLHMSAWLENMVRVTVRDGARVRVRVRVRDRLHMSALAPE